MAKTQFKNCIKREAKITAPINLWDEFDRIMENRGCRTRSEKFREAMRVIVMTKANGVANGQTI